MGDPGQRAQPLLPHRLAGVRMPAALGPVGQGDQRADRRADGVEAGAGASPAVQRISRTQPVAAPRSASAGTPAAARPGKRLAELALVAAPLPVLPHPAGPPAALPRRPGARPGLAVPSVHGDPGDRPWCARHRAGAAPVGHLQPRRGRVVLRRGAAQLRPRPDGGQDPARARPRAGRHAPGPARGAHGHRLRGDVADALHRHRGKLEAAQSEAAPGDRLRRHPHRAGPGRPRHTRLGAERSGCAAQRAALPGDHQLGAVPGAECQPVHALRRLLHPLRPARLPQPA
ncbi:hypothetical protein D3C76_493390 [compost metagenome]